MLLGHISPHWEAQSSGTGTGTSCRPPPHVPRAQRSFTQGSPSLLHILMGQLKCRDSDCFAHGGSETLQTHRECAMSHEPNCWAPAELWVYVAALQVQSNSSLKIYIKKKKILSSKQTQKPWARLKFRLQMLQPDPVIARSQALLFKGALALTHPKRSSRPLLHS